MANRLPKLLRLAMAVSGTFLVIRAVAGPFHFVVPVHAPIAAEIVFALGLAGCLTLRAVRLVSLAPVSRFAIATCLVLVTLCFVRALPFYFVSDDFVILKQAREFTPAHVRFLLTYSNGAFFRPFGQLVWALEAPWASVSPAAWHAVELVFHLVTCALAYRFVVRLTGNGRVALWTSALFGLHGAHPESVSFIAGQENLIAAAFLFFTLLLFLSYLERPRWGVMAASLVAAILALGTKELAYVLPVLVTMVAIRIRARMIATLPYWAVTGAALAYRWFVVGGIGGYKDLHLSTTGGLKALTSRIWAILAFPINWSTRLEWWAMAGLLFGLAAYVALTTSQPQRRDVWFALAWVVVCAAPGIQMLLIGPDMLNSRLLYLSAAGFAFLLGSAIETMPRGRVLAGVALAAFSITTLEHNLAIWGRTSALVKQTCASAALGTLIREIPASVNGVFFLANGFPECVELQKHQPR